MNNANRIGSSREVATDPVTQGVYLHEEQFDAAFAKTRFASSEYQDALARIQRRDPRLSALLEAGNRRTVQQLVLCDRLTELEGR